MRGKGSKNTTLRGATAMLQIHAAVFLFGMSGLFARLIDQPAISLVCGRTAFAALALAPLAMRKVPAGGVLGRGLYPALVAGGILALHWLAFFHSIQISTVAVGVLTFSAFPLFVCILEPIVFRERLRASDAASSCAVCLGLALIVPEYDLSSRMTRGAAYGLASGLAFAVLSLMNRKLVRSAAPAWLGFSQNLCAFAVLLPFAASQPLELGLRELSLLAALGVFCTALAHTLYIASLASIRAQTASVIAGLESVYGILLAHVFLGESPNGRMLLGGTIIVAASMLLSRSRSAKASDNLS